MYLDLIRIVGTTLSGQPAYIRIIRERHLTKIEIFIRICRRPQPKFAIFIWTFRWPLREFWGVLGRLCTPRSLTGSPGVQVVISRCSFFREDIPNVTLSDSFPAIHTQLNTHILQASPTSHSRRHTIRVLWLACSQSTSIYNILCLNYCIRPFIILKW